MVREHHVPLGPKYPLCVGFGCRSAAHGPEVGRATLSQAIADGRDAAKFMIKCGLHAADSLGRATASSVTLRRHAWLMSTGFLGDVQASLMDMPFDNTHLFGDKAASALERFKDTSAMAKGRWDFPPPLTCLTLVCAPSVATVGVTNCILYSRATTVSRQPSLFMEVVPTDLVGHMARSLPSPPPAATASKLL